MTGSTKKRKAEANGLDEMDRELYQKFRNAANAVSGLYTSSLNLQKRAFNGGARHTTEKLLQWALTQRENGEETISVPDLISALQAELVVLEGEDTCLAAAGDTPGGMGVWTPADARRGGGGGRAQLANIDFNNMVRPSQISRVPPPQPPLPPRDPPSPVSRAALTSPSAPFLFQTLNLNQGYEQGLGAKLGQAFTAGAPSSPAGPAGATRSHGPAGGGHGHHHAPSPGNRMDDD